MMKPDDHEKAKTLKLVCYNNLAQVSAFFGACVCLLWFYVNLPVQLCFPWAK